jgi:ankyrin repeat protein
MIAARYGYTAILNELLKHEKCDVNIQNNDGEIALMSAIWMGYPEVVSELLQHGATINTESHEETSWMMAHRMIVERPYRLERYKNISNTLTEEMMDRGNMNRMR